jgi:hypothetical protein
MTIDCRLAEDQTKLQFFSADKLITEIPTTPEDRAIANVARYVLVDIAARPVYIEKSLAIYQLSSTHESYRELYALFHESAPFRLETLTPLIEQFAREKQAALQNLQEKKVLFRNLPYNLKMDRDIALEAVKLNGLSFADLPRELSSDPEIIQEALNENGLVLQYLDYDQVTNKEIVLQAVKQNGLALQFASIERKEDKEIVLEAVKQNGLALEFASRGFRADPEIIEIAVDQNPLALQFDQYIKYNPEKVIHAIKKNGLCLRFLSDDAKNNKEFVLEAVKQNGLALQFASYPLNKDKGIVLEALKQTIKAFPYVSSDLKEDIPYILDLMRQNIPVFPLGSLEYYHHREIVFEAIRQDGLALEKAHHRYKNDKEIVLEAVRQNGLALQFTHVFLQQDKEVVLEAAKQNGNALKFASIRLKEDPNFRAYCAVECALNLTTPALNEAESSLKESFLLEFRHYKNPAIKNSIVNWILKNCQKEGTNLHTVIRKIATVACTPAQKRKLLLPLFFIETSAMSDEGKNDAIVLLKRHYKIFKDYKALQSLLLFQNALSEAGHSLDEFTPQQQEKIFQMILSEKNKSNLMSLLGITGCLLELNPHTIISQTEDTFTIANLAKRLVEDLQTEGFIPEVINGKDSAELIIEKFVINSRNQKALFQYCTLHKDDPEMKLAISRYITTVLDDSFVSSRNLANAHNPFLSAEQKEKWETALSPILIDRTVEAKPFDVKEFLETALLKDRHGGELLAHLSLEVLQGRCAIEAPSEIDAKIIELYNCTDKKRRLEILYELQALLHEETIEFKQDIKAAIADLTKIEYKKLSELVLVDSDDYLDLLLIGTDVLGSCQRVDGNKFINCCLMGYALDGKVRILAVKNKSGTIISRAILKVLLNSHNQPVLFIERTYGDKRYQEYLEKIALNKARSMSIDLYHVGDRVRLHSKGNIAPYEYEDASETGGIHGEGIKGGVYTVLASKISSEVP